jgi:hypothetical protein
LPFFRIPHSKIDPVSQLDKFIIGQAGKIRKISEREDRKQNQNKKETEKALHEKTSYSSYPSI